MNEQSSAPTIRRILVALDASPHSLAGLEAAARLAAHLDAELYGIFVEDINLLRLAEMPFTQEIGQFSARRRPLGRSQMDLALRTQANWARQALRTIAEREQLRWRFRVLRGAIGAELLAATQDTDLIILGKTGWSAHGGVGSTTETLLTEGHKLTLVLREGIVLGQAIMVLYDGSAGAMDALNLAGSLVEASEGRLIVLLISAEPQDADRLRSDVTAWTTRREMDVVFQWLSKADPFMVCSIAKTADSGVLILPHDSEALSREALLKILDDIDCPVLFVRRPAA